MYSRNTGVVPKRQILLSIRVASAVVFEKSFVLAYISNSWLVIQVLVKKQQLQMILDDFKIFAREPLPHPTRALPPP